MTARLRAIRSGWILEAVAPQTRRARAWGSTSRQRSWAPRCFLAGFGLSWKQRRCCACVAVAVIALCSAPASAAPIDAPSAHVALGAFDRYLRATLITIPASRRSDDAFVKSISANCSNVLGPPAPGPPQGLNVKVPTAFGEEIAFDLVLVGAKPLHAALARMTATFSKLRWSTNGLAAIVARFPAVEHMLFSVPPSDLCGDARAFAANPAAMPPGTRRFDAAVRRDSNAAQKAGAALGDVLGLLHGPADAPLIQELGRVLKRSEAADQKLASAEVLKVFNALGLT